MRVIIVSLFLLSMAVLVWHAPPSVAENSAEALTRRKCTHCHNAGRICERVGRHNTVMWQKTIDKMNRKGATISASDKAIIAQYLGSSRPASMGLCK